MGGCSIGQLLRIIDYAVLIYRPNAIGPAFHRHMAIG